MTPLVLDWMAAASVVLSTFLPSAFFSSTPVSSMKAPRVPEPSSREMTVMSWSASKSPAGAEEAAAESAEPQAARLRASAAAVTAAIAEVRFHVCYSPFFPNLYGIVWMFCQCFTGSKLIVPRFCAGFDHSTVQSR
ncbi:hypothetical protein [Gemmiger formicilis]|uniref:hypothetical protein n=1 Tax=Gemmiger formicilis TaxID=745368 RepID=UPI003521326D